MVKEILCIKCDKECIISVDKNDEVLDIGDYGCEMGKDFAKNEFESGMAILTTLVRIKGANVKVVPVKTTKQISKGIWLECSKALSRIYVGAPINIGDVVCKNILNTGVDIVCTKKINKC